MTKLDPNQTAMRESEIDKLLTHLNKEYGISKSVGYMVIMDMIKHVTKRRAYQMPYCHVCSTKFEIISESADPHAIFPHCNLVWYCPTCQAGCGELTDKEIEYYVTLRGKNNE